VVVACDSMWCNRRRPDRLPLEISAKQLFVCMCVRESGGVRVYMCV
jgi:hypothetical protein